MKRPAIPGVFLGIWLCGLSAGAQGDFLTPQEVDDVREAQEPSKRVLAYLLFAQRRITAIKEGIASLKEGAGRDAQKNLKEYIAILEALEGTIQDARHARSPLEKPIKEVEKRIGEFMTYFESLQPTSPGFRDYQYTLEEAIEMTRESLADAKKGAFPEVQEREPPRLPATPPPKPSSKDSQEEGPPRKRR